MSPILPSLFILVTAAVAAADVLTLQDGRKIPAEIGLIGKEKVQLNVNGKSVLLELTSFDDTTQKYLQELSMKREAKAKQSEAEKAADQAAEELRRAEAERTLPGRAQKGMAAFGGFCGLWVGMTEEDVELTAKGKQWDFHRKGDTVSLGASDWVRSPEGKKMHEEFTTLAKDAAGNRLEWESLLLQLHDGKVWQIRVSSPAIEPRADAAVPWYITVKSSIQKKCGKPVKESEGITVPGDSTRPEFKLWSADWEKDGRYVIQAQFTMGSAGTKGSPVSITFLDREAEKLAKFEL